MNQKTALITGGSRGLGKEMALELAKMDIKILFTYHRNEEKAKALVQEIEKLGGKAKGFQYDANQPLSGSKLLAEINAYLLAINPTAKIDFLINNAGTGLYSTVADTSEAQFDEMLNIHMKSVYFLTQSALPFLNDGGRIINVSSGLTRFSFPGSSAYAMMKGGIEVFTRYLAKELGTRKITANVVAPGAIATDFGGGTNRDDENKRSIITNVTALGRVGEPEDIGGVVAFLCSDAARWINGQRIEVSGGMLV